jgi:hypothetical protein
MAARPHTLKGLRIHEVSLVDVPANPGAQHVLFKRRDAMTAESALDRLLTRLGMRKTKNADGEVDPARYADDAAKTVDEATAALAKSIASILEDAAVTDKGAQIEKSIAEFRGYVDEHMTDHIEKAMRDVASVIEKKDDPTMPTVEEVQATNADLTKQLAAMQEELAKAKMTPDEAEAYKAMSPEQQKAYLAADAAGRKAMLSKRDDGAGDIRLTKALAETEDLKKRLASFEAERELQAFQKRATDVGLAPAQAETLLKASKGDQTAFDAMLDVIKAQNAQLRAGTVFKEFGSAGGTGPATGAARAEIEAAAQTLVKADPKLSMIAARVQVRKAQPELAQRERDEERAAVRAVS